MSSLHPRAFTRALITGLFVVTSSSAQTTSWPVPGSSGPGVVSTAWLADHRGDPDVVVLHIQHDQDFSKGHVPGARPLGYDAFTTKRDGLSTELPDSDVLRRVFEGVGVSDRSFVIVYASEAPMATRALLSLESIGLTRLALLDGGLAKWRAERRAEERETATFRTGTLTPRARPDFVATADWITSRLGRAGIAPIDTRADAEYVGEGERGGMPSAGHLAGARQLQWEELFQDEHHLLLKPRAELQRLFSDRMRPGDTVVTYCWIGYRASATYFVARALELPVRFYDGSYQDWLARKLPVTKGRTP